MDATFSERLSVKVVLTPARVELGPTVVPPDHPWHDVEMLACAKNPPTPRDSLKYGATGVVAFKQPVGPAAIVVRLLTVNPE
jgi:hypothetical protein